MFPEQFEVNKNGVRPLLVIVVSRVNVSECANAFSRFLGKMFVILGKMCVILGKMCAILGKWVSRQEKKDKT